jgi:hypothetical protein
MVCYGKVRFTGQGVSDYIRKEAEGAGLVQGRCYAVSHYDLLAYSNTITLHDIKGRYNVLMFEGVGGSEI